MKQIVIFTATVLLMLTSGHAFAAETGATGVVIKQVPLTYKDIALKDGHEMYDQLCAVCHGVTGMGDGPAAPALSSPVPDLTQFGAGTGGQATGRGPTGRPNRRCSTAPEPGCLP